MLRYTGSFNGHRLLDPVAGARYFLGEQFAFIDAIGMKQRQNEQIELFVAMMARLQKDAREKFGAPLVVIYSWPDENSSPGHGVSEFAQPMLVSVLKRLREQQIPLLPVDQQTQIPRIRVCSFADGHPNAFTNELIAGELNGACGAMSASAQPSW